MARAIRYRSMHWAGLVALATNVAGGVAVPAARGLAAQAQPAYAQSSHDQAPSADGERETLVIKGRSYPVYPADQLRSRGIVLREVPRDQNAVFVYIDAINALAPMPRDEEFGNAYLSAERGEWPQGPGGERLAEWMEQNRPALDLARAAAQMSDYALPPLAERGAPLMNLLLPTLADYRQMAKLLCIEGTRKLQAGDADAGLDDYLAVQRMSVHFADGFTLIEGLVGIAVRELSNGRIREAIESGTLSPEQLARVSAELAAIDQRFSTSEDMLSRERAFGEAIIDDLLLQASPLALFDANSVMGPSPGGGEPSGWGRLASALKRVYLPDRAVKRHIRGFYDNIIEQSRATAGGGIPTINEEQALAQIPAWSFPAKMMLPSLTRVYELTLRGRSNALRTRVHAAAQAYQQRHGSPPAATSYLVPDYLPDVPTDPMTGTPLEIAVAPGGSAVTGVEPITRENEEQIRARRKAPVIVNRRASDWRKYVDEFAQRHRLDASQTNAAEAVLRSMESQAVSYEAAHGESIQKLRAAGQQEALAREVRPLDDMFGELKKRLDAIPTARQRAEADKERP